MGMVNARYIYIYIIVKDQGQIFGAIKGSSMKILLGQDLDHGRGWKYRCLCSVPPP